MNNILEDKIAYANLLFSQVLSYNDAANYLGISKKYLFKLSVSGYIKSYKGKRQYYYKSDLNNWLKGYRIINPKFNQISGYSTDRDN